MSEELKIPELEGCDYCGGFDTDHKHANGHRCCMNCCASHGIMTIHEHGEYEFVDKIVENKNRILAKYIALLKEVSTRDVL